METDNTTGTESDTSEWDLANAALTSENSEDSDEYGIYYGDEHIYDSVIGGANQSVHNSRFSENQMTDQQASLQMRKILNQMNMSEVRYGISSSLYPIHETGYTGTESADSYGENSDTTISEHGSPVHDKYPVYGRYQKLPGQVEDSDTDQNFENLMLHRLPGENLGMILGIEGGKFGRGTVTSVAVKSVTLGGAAYRASGGTKGVCVGDEICTVNGLDLCTLSNDECIQIFKDMPLRVSLGVRRGRKDISAYSVSPLPFQETNAAEKPQKLPEPAKPPTPIKPAKSKPNKPVEITRRRDASDSEDDGFGGFATYHVTVEKHASENLGISIVPSYGSTREYYQIKRILPSGAAAHSGELQVGDRLVSCNGTSLRGLTQSHCLSVIKAASHCGNIDFEVIRPVYTGSSMEISVTVNNGTHSNLRHSGYDPSQYSVKSQSYDRNVDVVVTSESEDYLTVSEDEFSKTGRLANIPESEANQVFVSNSVRLAYQNLINTIEEESTETESENIPGNGEIHKAENTETVDLNKLDTSPYHIPSAEKNRDENLNELDLKLDLLQYKIEPKSVQETSSSPRLPLIHGIPQTELDKISISSQSPRSPRSPRSDSDKQSPRSPVPESDHDQISPRSPTQKARLSGLSHKVNSLDSRKSSGTVSDRDSSTNSSRSPVNTFDDIYVNSAVSYTKRQQVPSESETPELDLPYNYPPESIVEDITVSDSERTRYNPLYEDSNLSEFTDSEAQDSFVSSPVLSKRDFIPSTDLDKISIGSNRNPVEVNGDNVSLDSGDENIAVPPPEEFSDRHTYFEDFERQGSNFDNENEQIYDEDDVNLAFNSELTAPFDIVLQEQGIDTKASIVDIETTHDDHTLKVPVVSYDNQGTVIISPFEQPHTYPTSFEDTDFNQEGESYSNRMDDNSEAMLKDALDMDYDNLSETAKYENRLNLGKNMENDENEEENVSESVSNVVAENIATEIVHKEGSYGYYMESDDEPDQFPEEDAQEDAPALPDMPPPLMLSPNGPQTQNDVTINVKMNGDLKESNDKLLNKVDTAGLKNNLSDKTAKKSAEIHVGFDSIDTKNEVEGDVTQSAETPAKDKEPFEPDVIVPVKVERKVEIPISYKNPVVKNEDEIIVPVTAKREFQLPAAFADKLPSPRKENEDAEPLVTVTAKKTPPPVMPKPRKSKAVEKENTEQESKANEIVEETIVPEEVKKDNTKHLVNVISVVNALKAGAKDKEPDVVDKIEKEVKDNTKKAFSSIIKVGEKGSVTDMSPPAVEQVSTDREQITVKKNMNVEASPPKADIIEENKAVVMKSNVKKDTVEKDEKDQFIENDSTALKTVISVEKSNLDQDTQESKGSEDKPRSVPPLDLTYVSGANTQSSPPNQLNDNSPVYKTTIGVLKPDPKLDRISPETKQKKSADVAKSQIQTVPELQTQNVVHKQPSVKSSVGNAIEKIEKQLHTKQTENPKQAPVPVIRPLSQIKPLSFNPKSLSQTGSKPSQYKTSISTLGIKPSLSSLSKTSAHKEAEHPIKRMETMPFEVSILKGILGIGIKTTMTPEGYVKVTEILPNGPVGREGNIKVGDFILSINSNQLTGLTDGKVQQILRLLPRGLSKIVASAVPPDQCGEHLQGEQSHVQQSLELTKSLPVQSSLASSPRSASLTTSLNPRAVQADKLEHSPHTSPRQLSVTVNPNAGISVHHQPVPAPRSPSSLRGAPKQPQVPPKPAKRSSAIPQVPESSVSQAPVSLTTTEQVHIEYQVNGLQTQQLHQSSPSSSSTVSPVTSARQQEQSPRTPPPLAPKPKRTPIEKQEWKEDSNASIEAEIFVSVNANPESSQNPKSANILPGSVNYDIVDKDSNKTRWTAGMVSSADIKVPQKPGIGKGIVDVVCESDLSHSDISASTNTQEHYDIDTHEYVTEIPNKFQNTERDTDIVASTNTQEHDDVVEREHVTEIADKFQNTERETDIVAHTNTQEHDNIELEHVTELLDKSQSTEKDTEESIKEQFEGIEKDIDNTPVLLVQRSRSFSASSTSSSHHDFNECDVVEEADIPEEVTEEDLSEEQVQSKSEDYESDFEEETLPETLKDTTPDSADDKNEANMAKLKSLAEEIVTDVFLSIKPSDFLPERANKEESSTEEEFVTPKETPSSGSFAPASESGHSVTEAPAFYDVVQPMETEAPPSLPDSPPPLPQSLPPLTESETPKEGNSQLIVNDLALYPDSDHASEETSENKIEQSDSGLPEVMNVVEVSVSQDLHATAPNVQEKGYEDNPETLCDIEQNNVNSFVSPQVTEEPTEQGGPRNEPVDIAKRNNEQTTGNTVINDMALSGHEHVDKENKIDINSVQLNNNVSESDVKKETKSIIKVANDVSKLLKEKDVHEDVKVNGYSESTGQRSVKQDHEEKHTVTSDTESPKAKRKSSSRVDEILSQAADIHKGTFSLDTERMIRMFSTTEEPVHEGEGEIIEVTINKGVTGLGFIIQGGKCSPKGDLPVTIKRIFRGGPADGVLQEGDEICSVNGEDMSDMRHSEARTHLKFLPDGELVMKVRRYQDDHE